MAAVYDLVVLIWIVLICISRSQEDVELNATFVVMERSSLYSCAAECSLTTKCRSFVFFKTNLTCHLSNVNVTRSDNSKLIVSNRWSQNITGACSGFSCPRSSYVCPDWNNCRVTRNNQQSCEIACGPPGYRRVGEMCVKIHMTGMNFTQAQSVCRSEGARLVKVDTEEKNTALKLVLEDRCFSMYSYYMGLQKDYSGKFFWDDGSELSYSGWGENEPSQKKQVKCVIFSKTNHHQWLCKRCFGKPKFICEHL